MNVQTVNVDPAPWLGYEFGRTHGQYSEAERLFQAMLADAYLSPQIELYRGYPDLQEEIAYGEVAVSSTEAAAGRLSEVVTCTPLVAAEGLSASVGCNVQVKLENQQRIGAFKIRGAFNMIAALSLKEQARGLVAASTGNHAQGVAYAAQYFGVPATVVMPEGTPEVKVAAVRDYGATVVLRGANFAEANDFCREFTREPAGPLFVPPFEHPHVIAGQGTIGKEILEQNPETDVVFVQGGGWGCITGIAQYVKTVRPDVQVVAVEPETSDVGRRSLQKGSRVTLQTETIAEGLDVQLMGALTFHLAQRYVDDAITVSEREIQVAMRDMYKDVGVRAEASGAVGYAGVRALAQAHNLAGKNVVAICTGANISPEDFDKLAA